MVVISSTCLVMFLLCSLLLASQRPARGDDQHATIWLLVYIYKELFDSSFMKCMKITLSMHGSYMEDDVCGV